jgi:hypothetical protein
MKFRDQRQVELALRRVFLRLLPTGSIGAELGVFKGEFSRQIIQVVRPKELHLIDVWWYLYGEFYPDWGEYTDYGRLRTKEAFELTKRNVESCHSTGRIIFHVGDDVAYLNSFPDHYFDWIYIDSSHEFDHTMAELEAAALKVKPTGFIMGHDWHDDPSSEHLGVRKAIEEFILQGPYRLDHLDRASTQWCLRRKSKSNLARLPAWHRIGALTRADHRSLPQSGYQMPAFMVVKNETTRLPLTLQYHRSLGVDGFFVVDNNSTDGTLEFLLSQPATHVYTTGESYREARVGINWIEQLLTVHSNNRWCLIIDADEHLIYQGCESLPLPKLCKELDSRRFNCLPTMFLDMYSHLPILQTQLTSSAATLLDCCPYFDATGYYKRGAPGIPSISGGVRARLFWPEVDLSFAGLSTLMRLAFDEQAYLDMHPDVYTAVQNGAIESGLQHFVTFGRFEGRAIKVRDLDWLERQYRDQNPDVDQAVLRGGFESGLEHFVRFGRFEGRWFWSCQLPLLTQVPLLRWNPQLKIHVGRHDLFGAEWHPSGAVGGILLHFRLMSDLLDRASVVMKDADSPASPAWSEQSERYCKVLREQPNLSAFCENSIRYVDSNQLVQIGLMSALAELGGDHPLGR